MSFNVSDRRADEIADEKQNKKKRRGTTTDETEMNSIKLMFFHSFWLTINFYDFQKCRRKWWQHDGTTVVL